jgi:hypothetical protein
MSPPIAKPFEDYVRFEDKQGHEYFFVRLVKKYWLLSWRKEADTRYSCIGLRPEQVEIDVLKDLQVWAKLDKKLQEQIGQAVEKHQTAITAKMAKARSKRRNKYADVPREYVCQKCGKSQSIPPGTVMNRVRKLGILLDDYIKRFYCQKCKPTKGRQKKDYGNVPDKLVCKCGHTVKYHPSMIIATAKKKGLSVENFVKSYQCQKCNPTKGRKKGATKKVKKTTKKKQRRK